jgi:hypothetical protein
MPKDYRKSLTFLRFPDIFTPMETLAKSIDRALNSAVDATHAILYHQGTTPFQQQAVLGVDLLVTPAVCAAFALTEVGKHFFRELQRWRRIREKRPASPSLRGTPTPDELADDWTQAPRSLPTCLRLGSRLADLEPTLDNSLIYKTLPNGRKHIAARKGGVKGWLRDHRVPVRYNTVMRYKKLAQRLRQVLVLDDRIPLEWLLTGLPPGQTLSAGLTTSFETARRHIQRILRDNPTLAALTRLVEKKLGIQRLVSVRRRPRRGRQTFENPKKTKELSVISRTHSVSADGMRTEATKHALKQLLGTRHPAGGALHLQNRALRWLSSLRS